MQMGHAPVRSRGALFGRQEAVDRQVALAGVVVEAEHGRAGGQFGSFCAIAARVAPEEMPTSIPSSRVRSGGPSLRAASASTWITPSSTEVSRFFGKPAPMPWIGADSAARR